MDFSKFIVWSVADVLKVGTQKEHLVVPFSDKHFFFSLLQLGKAWQDQIDNWRSFADYEISKWESKSGFNNKFFLKSKADN